VLNRINFLNGAQINLTKNKNIFLEVATGYKIRTNVADLNNSYTYNGELTWGVGIGYRIQ